MPRRMAPVEDASGGDHPDAAGADPPAALSWVRALLALVLVLLLVRVIFGHNPWQDGIAERLREGQSLRFIDYVSTWGWWAAAATAPVVAVLLVTLRRWLRFEPAPELPALAAPPRPGVAWAGLVAAAVLAAAVLAWPRMSQSLFEDERYNVQWSIDGFYYQDDAGELRFLEADWRAALWYYDWPNNHVPHTWLARASLAVWRTLASPQSRLVDERVVRLPALLAGLAGIAVLAGLAWRLGHPWAGVVAAWILALHPWHLRYASEARGYTLALLFIGLLLWGWLRALEHGSWRRWAWVGALQLLLLWNYMGAVYLVALLGLATFVALVRLHAGRPSLRPQLRRWAAVCLLAGLAWIILMAPNVAQFALYLENEIGNVKGRWYRDLGAYFLVGLPWGGLHPNPHFWELSDAASRRPFLLRAGASVAVALAITGAWRLARGGMPRGLLLPVLVLPPLLTVALAASTSAKVHPHYLVLALPTWALLLALGLEGGVARLGRGAAAAVACVALAGFAVATQAPRFQLQAIPLQPWRDSVELTRPTLDPLAPENERVLTTSFYMPATYYDPALRRFSTVDELRALLAEADASGRPLFVNYGRPRLARQRRPELVKFVNREDLFEEVATLYGLPLRGNRRVLRYRGGSAPPADLAGESP